MSNLNELYEAKKKTVWTEWNATLAELERKHGKRYAGTSEYQDAFQQHDKRLQAIDAWYEQGHEKEADDTMASSGKIALVIGVVIVLAIILSVI